MPERPSQEFDREWNMYVDGEFVDGEGNEVDVLDPATEEAITSIRLGTKADVDRAVDAAHEIFQEFRWTNPRDRADMLYEIADVIEEHRRELAELETLENGKPISQALSDADNAVARLKYYAGGADKFYGDAVMDSQDAVGKTIFEPYGVIGFIIPWNWPLVTSIDFPAMAVATGNTCVLKPSTDTPLSALRMAELVDGILPDGVFNVVTGSGSEVGSAISSHELVRKIAFVGHDETGEHILHDAAENITPAMVELGAKNPAIVFPDANMERAVPGVLASSFKNNGEACTGSERLLLHEDIFDEFLSRLEAVVDDLVVADNLHEDTKLGPLASEEQYDFTVSMVDQAVKDGATIVAQSSLPEKQDGGYWFPATVLDDVTPEMDIANEEVFGPVLAAMPFSSEDEAVKLANAVDYGLADYVWTQDLNRAHRLASRLEAGRIAINNAAGGELGLTHGGYKRSGIGRKNDFTESMREFVQPKAVKIDLSETPPSI